MNINNYIQKVKEKPEEIRKQYLTMWMIGSMLVVGSVWYLTLYDRFSDGHASVQASNDIKPFTMLGQTFKNTYSNITAGVGEAKGILPKTEVVPVKNQKMINLIPVYE